MVTTSYQACPWGTTPALTALMALAIALPVSACASGTSGTSGASVAAVARQATLNATIAVINSLCPDAGAAV